MTAHSKSREEALEAFEELKDEYRNLKFFQMMGVEEHIQKSEEYIQYLHEL